MKNKLSNKWLLIGALCLIVSFSSCKKELTIEERIKDLETKITEGDCKELTRDSLKTVLKDLRDINFNHISIHAEEDIHSIQLDKLYVGISVQGNVKGIYNDVDTIYTFFLYGQIPEELIEKKEFAPNEYSLSIKNRDGFFVYDNKNDIDSVNKEVALTQKEEKLNRKKDFVIGNTKVRFDGKEGNASFYSSKTELTVNEIAEAIQKKITSEGINMIRFYCDNKEYANYVYATQCIILIDNAGDYRSPGDIYKIINGKPVKM